MDTLFAAPCKFGTNAMSEGCSRGKVMTDQPGIFVSSDVVSVEMMPDPMLTLH